MELSNGKWSRNISPSGHPFDPTKAHFMSFCPMTWTLIHLMIASHFFLTCHVHVASLRGLSGRQLAKHGLPHTWSGLVKRIYQPGLVGNSLKIRCFQWNRSKFLRLSWFLDYPSPADQTDYTLLTELPGSSNNFTAPKTLLWHYEIWSPYHVSSGNKNLAFWSKFEQLHKNYQSLHLPHIFHLVSRSIWKMWLMWHLIACNLNKNSWWQNSMIRFGP